MAWKRAFKEAESRNDVPALRRALTLIDELPAFGQLNTLPWRIGSPPALPTARYLKRRANRYLRRQAADAPERYLALALPLLTASRSLNPGTQWLTTDILYGRNRVVLASHGRILRLLPPADPDPWARSDQAGDVWAAALPAVRRLFADPTRAWQVREFAARVIVANGQNLPRVPASRLPGLFTGQSPLLELVGEAEAIRRIEGRGLPVPILGAVLARASAEAGRRILGAWRAKRRQARTVEALLADLTGRLAAALKPVGGYGYWAAEGAWPDGARITDVEQAARLADVLAGEFAMSGAVLRELRGKGRPLIWSRSQAADGLLEFGIRAAVPEEWPAWIDIIAQGSAAQRERLGMALLESTRGRVIAPTIARSLVFNGIGMADLRWAVVHASAMSIPKQRALLAALLTEPDTGSWLVRQARENALGLPVVADLAAGLAVETIREALGRYPELLGAASGPTAVRLLTPLSAQALSNPVRFASDAALPDVTRHLVARFADETALVAFWESVAVGATTPDGFLRHYQSRRERLAGLLNDPEIARLVAQSDDAARQILRLVGAPDWDSAEELLRDVVGRLPDWPTCLADEVPKDEPTRAGSRPAALIDLGLWADAETFLAALTDGQVASVLMSLDGSGLAMYQPALLRRLRRADLAQALAPAVARFATDYGTRLRELLSFLRPLGAEHLVAAVPAHKLARLLEESGGTERGQLADLAVAAWVPSHGLGPLAGALTPRLPERDWRQGGAFAAVAARVAADDLAASLTLRSVAVLLWMGGEDVGSELRERLRQRATADGGPPRIVPEIVSMIEERRSDLPDHLVALLRGIDAAMVVAAAGPGGTAVLLGSVPVGGFPELLPVIERLLDDAAWADAFWGALSASDRFARQWGSDDAGTAAARVLEQVRRPAAARLRAILELGQIWYYDSTWARIEGHLASAVAGDDGRSLARQVMRDADGERVVVWLRRMPLDAALIGELLARADVAERLARPNEPSIARLAALLADDRELAVFVRGRGDDLGRWLRIPAVRGVLAEPRGASLVVAHPEHARMLVESLTDAEWASSLDAMTERVRAPGVGGGFWAAVLAGPLTYRVLDRLAVLAAAAPGSLTGESAATMAVLLAAEAWPRLREPVLDAVRRPREATAFWSRLAGRADVAALPALADPDVRATVEMARTTAVLRLADERFDAPLARWFAAQPDLCPANSEALLDAATHPLPEVRRLALARLLAGGPGLRAVTRLAESGLPPCVAAARTLLEGDAALGPPLEVALALLDSPVPAVRGLGWAFAGRNKARIDQAALAAALAEHDDPRMLALAVTLAEAAGQPAPALRQRVLRLRGEGRRAKEAVKQAERRSPTVNAGDLLDLARGRVPLDAEWAAVELAKRVLAGGEIDGVVVEGPVER